MTVDSRTEALEVEIAALRADLERFRAKNRALNDRAQKAEADRDRLEAELQKERAKRRVRKPPVSIPRKRVPADWPPEWNDPSPIGGAEEVRRSWPGNGSPATISFRGVERPLDSDAAKLLEELLLP